MHAQPLLLEPILKEKVWGGRRLARYHKPLPDTGAPVGESWELADLPSTSPEGGGGDAAASTIAHGHLRGATLRDAADRLGPDLLGRIQLTQQGGFPLLVKYLDAADNLSVQVHPSPAYAAAHPDAHLKTETWIVLDAEPGATIYHGFAPGTSRDDLRAAIDAGTVDQIMHAVPARVGDVHHLPSGTVHALGAGVLVAEVQSPSDTTFRLFDWGRTGRTLHIQQALECIDVASPTPHPPIHADDHLQPIAAGAAAAVVEANDLYQLTVLTAHADARCPVPHGDAHDIPAVLMLVGGRATLASPTGSFEPVDLRLGDTVLLPARLGDAVLHAAEPTRVIQATLRATA
jgi:mannose-6-phosphate isomerase